MKTFSLDYFGKKIEGYAQKIENKIWIYKNGITTVVECEVSSTLGRRSRKKTEGKASTDQIIAPMPGKITKILCHKSDDVIQGKALIVMEAMKMEYTLKSEISGKIANINVSVGQQVALGELLIQLEMKK